ncbi:MAG: hypothetical protein DRQ47_04510 [Gammaproteobacteria bacterium]|nr:MAG: hypothetical protein DRQ47_04510 [Gammaproteobacteria bacterium]
MNWNNTLGYIKYILTSSQWWFGFYVGAAIFLLVGDNWDSMTSTHQWYATGAIGIFVLIVIAVLLHKPEH